VISGYYSSSNQRSIDAGGDYQRAAGTERTDHPPSKHAPFARCSRAAPEDRRR